MSIQKFFTKKKMFSKIVLGVKNHMQVVLFFCLLIPEPSDPETLAHGFAPNRFQVYQTAASLQFTGYLGKALE